MINKIINYIQYYLNKVILLLLLNVLVNCIYY